MLIHIRPRLFSIYRNVSLIDLGIEPWGVHLVGGRDLATRRPYRNKFYAVACRRKGLMAIDGILLDVPRFVQRFEWAARWAIEAEFSVTHRVICRVLDRDFDCVSDKTTLWHAHMCTNWADRFPKKRAINLVIEPVMEIDPDRVDSRRQRSDVIEGGRIVTRSQNLSLPTIEPERLTDARFYERTPTLEMAFGLG